MAENPKLRQIIATLRQHFPNSPKTRREAYPRLFALGFFFVAMLIILLVEAPKRMLNMQVLWLQFVGAALLWWEANAADQIDLAVEGLLRAVPSPPATRAERILYRFSAVFSFVPMGLGITAVATLVGAAAGAHGWRALLIAELKVASFAAITIAFALWSGRFLDRQLAKLAKRITEAEAQGRLEQREIVRRALRTIGFALVALATVLQMVLVWAE